MPVLVVVDTPEVRISSTPLAQVRFMVSGSLRAVEGELPATVHIYLRTETKYLFGEYAAGGFLVSDVPVGRWPLTIEAAGFIKHVEEVAVLEGDRSGMIIELYRAPDEPTPDDEPQGCSAVGPPACTAAAMVLLLTPVIVVVRRHRRATRIAP
jgi:hypothetical protein